MSVISQGAIGELVDYAERTGLLAHEDRTWAVNALLEALQLDSPRVEPS